MESAMFTTDDSPPPHPSGRLIGALCGLAGLAFAFFQYATWRQYLGGYVRGDAVQVFDAMLSQFAAGEGMVLQHTGSHFLANHVMLWLYPMGWMYQWHDDLFTQLTPFNLLLAAAAIPLGLFAHARIRDERMAFLVALLFTTNSLTASLRWAVHPESMFPIWWFLLFLGLEWRRTALVIAGVAGMLCMKEDQAVWLTVFAAWGLFFRRLPPRTGLGLLMTGLVAFVTFKFIMNSVPRVEDDPVTGFWWVARYDIDADSTVGVLWWFATHPHVMLGRVLLNETWIAVALAGGLVAWRAWRELLLLLPTAVLLFSTAPGDPWQTAQYYYSYVFLPPLFLAVCEGIRLQIDSVALWRLRLAVGVLAFAALFLPTRNDSWSQSPWQFPDKSEQRAFVRAVLLDRPAQRAAIHYDLAAWAPRGWQVLHPRPHHLVRADLLLLDVDRVSVDIGRQGTIDLINEARDPNGPWRMVENHGTIVLFERKAAADRP